MQLVFDWRAGKDQAILWVELEDALRLMRVASLEANGFIANYAIERITQERAERGAEVAGHP